MFDVLPNLLSSVASFLFPLFASYKALKTSDPAQLTPWLMYWVVLACALLVESWTVWLLVWIPFYAYIRLLFLLYLVLPQTQGARLIYEEYVHPRLEENETAIEEFIASAHARLRSAGIAYLKRAIELLKTNVFGMPPSPEAAAAAAPPEPQTAQSYTQSLLARFTLPSPRWNAAQGTTTAAPPGAGGGPQTGLTTDFYNLITSAIGAATAASTPSHPDPTGATTKPSAWPASIIPESIRSAGDTARMAFIRAQRERLAIVMSALDREEQAARQQGEMHDRDRDLQQQQGDNKSAGGRGAGIGAGMGDKKRSLSEHSIASGLSKSRSEGDFEKLDAPSGAEEEMDVDEGVAGEAGTPGVRRRGAQETGAGAASGRGGGWMPWAWGGGGDAGRSSGMEK